jgi:hypothetical protein
VLGWTVTVNDEIIPMWPSVVAFLLFGALSATLWREARRQ